jgi:hypothetical protein
LALDVSRALVLEGSYVFVLGESYDALLGATFFVLEEESRLRSRSWSRVFSFRSFFSFSLPL